MQSLLHHTKVLWSRHRAVRTHNLKRRGAAHHSATQHSAAQRGGFTLVELMVVLAIAVLVTSITVNGFRELSDSNKRTSCQTNLRQVYQGLRLYMNDHTGGVPLYYHVNDAGETERNIGLWALYTYPKDGTTDELADVGSPAGTAVSTKPVARYVRNSKVLHCPAGYIDGEVIDGEEIDRESLYLDEERTQLNQRYLSYQVSDAGPDGLGVDGNPETETYMPWRRVADRSQAGWKRQLNLFVDDTTADADTAPDRVAGAQPQDDTIVTWCRWHQFNRDFDNVLFFDGSVQYIQREQPHPDPDVTEPLTHWRRVPKPVVP